MGIKAPADAPHRPRYRSLDLWRGLACVLVVILHSTHANWVREGSQIDATAHSILSSFWCGVPMFFVISGYCIAAAVDSARRQGAHGSVFFLRRFRRIYPPYWIFLAVSIPIAALLWSPGQTGILVGDYNPLSLNGWQWLGTLTLTETWRHHLVGNSDWHIYWSHAWTLCYEEQFYCICGVILLLCPRRFFLAAALVTAAVCCTAPLIFLRGALDTQGFPRGFFFDGNWLLFAAGLLLYYQNNYATPAVSHGITGVFAVVAVLLGLFRLVLIQRLVEDHGEIMYATHYAAGGGFVLLLSLLRRWDDALADSRWTQPLTICGRMCYSLYLVHLPITLVASRWLCAKGVTGWWATIGVTVPVAVGLSLAVGWIFHLGVERYFLNPPVTIGNKQTSLSRA